MCSCGSVRSWSQQAYRKASNTATSQFFGGSVGVSGDTVVVRPGQMKSRAARRGSITPTKNTTARAPRACSCGTRQVEPTGPEAEQHWDGRPLRRVRRDVRDTVVVRAWGEASSTMGVNGNRNDNSAERAGRRMSSRRA
ncbi:MAG: FG-GAP repeat protein [Verrucomicrobiales bacterium]|nr:FG-GAP repeat protein [Verrucomicrobiales bacterium]